MMKATIAECRLSDLREIIPELRREDLAEACAMGITPRRLLYRLWNESSIKRTLRFDGRIAAVGGCVGGLSDPCGEPWLFTSGCVDAHPVKFYRAAVRETARLLDTRTELETGVLASYSRSRKFWRMIGFEEVGTYELSGVPFVRMRMGHN